MFSRARPQSSRWSLRTIVSLAVHSVGVGGVFLASAYLTARPAPEPRRSIHSRLTFVNIATTPVVFVTPRRRSTVPEWKPPDVAPDPLPRLHRAEIQPPAPLPSPREGPPAPRPAKPRVESVAVGAFETPAARTRAPERRRLVEPIDFDAQSRRPASPEPDLGNAAVGAFQSATAADSRRGSDAAGHVVADAGFGVASRARPAPAAHTVGETGFGGAPKGERPGPRPPGAVQRAGFSDIHALPPRTPRPVSRPQRVETSVEIIVKPTPEYTDEARDRKIEGEVLLEVEFRASGKVRVLRVVRGLGHGLDESAARAAERILFKPAQGSQGPVDLRATVQIVFRLT